MRIGFLGGTFDPIHFGHINLALHLLEAHALDRVLFSPAAHSPHKCAEPPVVDAASRLEMIRLAIAPISFFALHEQEASLGGVSYTIDAIQKLKESHPDDQIFLLLGEDLLPRLHEWKEVEALLSLAAPLIGSRHKGDPEGCGLTGELRRKIKEGWTRIPLLEISSTFLRDRLRHRLYCGHLVPAKVLDYIYDHHLYFSL